MSDTLCRCGKESEYGCHYVYDGEVVSFYLCEDHAGERKGFEAGEPVGQPEAKTREV